MAILEVTYYQVECDCCGEICDFGDYSAVASQSDVNYHLDYADWQVIDGEYLCDDCWMWPSDADDHDGDEYVGTDDPIRRHLTHDGPCVSVMTCPQVHPQTGERCGIIGSHEVHSVNLEVGPDWTVESEMLLQ